MATKRSTTTTSTTTRTAVSKEEVRAALKTTRVTTELSSLEENVLRMRHGASVAPSYKLPMAHDGLAGDAAAEIEKIQARVLQAAQERAVMATRKQKIIGSLKAKKPAPR